MSPLALGGYILLALPAAYAGGLLHELTHAVAVRLVGGSVEGVSLWPWDLAVGFDVADDRRMALVALAPILLTPLVGLAVWETVKSAPWPWLFPALGIVAGYLPLSRSDWAGLPLLASAMRR